MLRLLFNAGVDVFRLNMSHGDHDKLAGIAKAMGASGITVNRSTVSATGPVEQLTKLKMTKGSPPGMAVFSLA